MGERRSGRGTTRGDGASPTLRLRIRIQGIVQGVGFRPFVHRLARELGIAGAIHNFAGGVEIEAEGEAQAVAAFRARLEQDRPPIAVIDRVDEEELQSQGDSTFRIIPSQEGEGGPILLSPDVATCPDCECELFDPADRRYRHPFINCTNCGPRFTIIRGLPYDRPQTTMAAFGMCSRCRAEYEDLDNRRYHAQPVACPRCGPVLELTEAAGTRRGEEALARAVELIRGGQTVAVKGLGGFHLACDATSEEAVRGLRRAKGREERPFAIMCPDLDAIEALCRVTDHARSVLCSPRRPIVLLDKRPDAAVAEGVAPDSRYYGAMLPYTPLHHLLLQGVGSPALVMTSGNVTDEPLAVGNEEARRRLGPMASAFLCHDREILIGCDDSIVRPFGADRHVVLRRARGYVPFPVRMRRECRPVLGVGGHLKNTFCLLSGEYAYLSQHIGDLEDALGLEYFERSVEHFLELFRVRPEAVAHDLHPDYLSTRHARELAESWDVPLVACQHHHAHIVSCLAERGHNGPAIGVACDGTGYGDDGTIWGCEIAVCEGATYERLASLRTIPLPGGEQAVREPWRVAAMYLDEAFGRDGAWELACLADRRDAWDVLRQMADRGINCPPASSAGRLFDAVAALCGLGETVSYEAQGPLRLEAAADEEEPGAYEFEIGEADGLWRMDPVPMIRQAALDLQDGVSVGRVSTRFHRGFAGMLVAGVERVAEESELKDVALSGGTFQNERVLLGLSGVLAQRGYVVHVHESVPPNDGGLSLGQAVIASHRRP